MGKSLLNYAAYEGRILHVAIYDAETSLDFVIQNTMAHKLLSKELYQIHAKRHEKRICWPNQRILYNSPAKYLQLILATRKECAGRNSEDCTTAQQNICIQSLAYY